MSTGEQALIVMVVPRQVSAPDVGRQLKAGGARRLDEGLSNREAAMARYRMVYDDERVVRETFQDVDVVGDEHVQTLEQLD